jgi:hypothetical protein
VQTVTLTGVRVEQRMANLVALLPDLAPHPSDQSQPATRPLSSRTETPQILRLWNFQPRDVGQISLSALPGTTDKITL